MANAAGVSRPTVSRLENGHAETLTLASLRAVAGALDVRLDVVPRWRGGDLDRLLNRRHSALHESVARHFSARLANWTVMPEVSFSIYGERGIIDVLAWHAATRSLLVIELKTELVDVNEMIGTLDRKRRLAPRIGGERGLRPATVSQWLVLTDARTTRRRIDAHRMVLRAAYPADGRAMRAWLNAPQGAIAALSLWPVARSEAVGPRRVRRR